MESMGDSEVRIAQRLRIAEVLMDLARWKESEEQQRHALAEATALAHATSLSHAAFERPRATAGAHQPTRRGRAADATGTVEIAEGRPWAINIQTWRSA